jgi:hypothetical protein
VSEIREHYIFRLARIIVHARLLGRLGAAKTTATSAATYNAGFRHAYKELYREVIKLVEDAGATGDQVVEQAVRSVPPGTTMILMGIQNIKGTGLDFVYRWVALDKVVSLLDTLDSSDPSKRTNALRELESFGDHGLVDSGLGRLMLTRRLQGDLPEAERQQMERIHQRMERIFKAKVAGLAETGGSGSLKESVLTWLEGWFDNLDSIRRYNHSTRLNRDLVDHRVSIARASVEMREVYARQKGGWLAKMLKK